MPNLVTDPQQQPRDDMHGARPLGENTNEHRPPSLYYDQTNSRQTFHPPAGAQTNNGYVPIQNKPGVQQPTRNGRQVSPHVPLILRMIDSWRIVKTLDQRTFNRSRYAYERSESVASEC